MNRPQLYPRILFKAGFSFVVPNGKHLAVGTEDGKGNSAKLTGGSKPPPYILP